jgi:hypothetical protein
MAVEFVDAQGVRQSVRVVSGQTTVSGVAPFLIKFDASGTRAPAAFGAQSAIPDAEAHAFLMTGYRLNYGENRGGVWQYPQGSSHSRDEDTGPPVFSYVYQTPGSYPVRLRTRDALGNEADVRFNVVVNAPPAPILIRASDGRWPNFVSGARYALEANGDYRSFGALETGGRHNIVIEKTGSGADPRIGRFSPDGRSKFSATQPTEYRAAHIRLVNVDMEEFFSGQRGYDYVGVIGGMVRRFSDGGQAFLWQEGTESPDRMCASRGGSSCRTRRFATSERATGSSCSARSTGCTHATRGLCMWKTDPTTYLMLRVYGSNFSFRNNLWFSQANGGSANGTLIGDVGGEWHNRPPRGEMTIRLDHSTRPATARTMAISRRRQILQNNQFYAAGSYVTNAIASVGGGNPSGSSLVYPRLMAWKTTCSIKAAMWPSRFKMASCTGSTTSGETIEGAWVLVAMYRRTVHRQIQGKETTQHTTDQC